MPIKQLCIKELGDTADNKLNMNQLCVPEAKAKLILAVLIRM